MVTLLKQKKLFLNGKKNYLHTKSIEFNLR
uniref:Uncharacterized protein n=1 Tax=Siphoviridae sp. ctWhx86 TaxID=2826362 RepID=A0A8S5QPV1_9CAUD|nr:MAG TPA: hypothetical protein [Siphoviridae sp. ctWhx86]